MTYLIIMGFDTKFDRFHIGQGQAWLLQLQHFEWHSVTGAGDRGEWYQFRPN